MFVPQVCANVTNAITVIVILFIFIFPALMMMIIMMVIINMINIIIRERLGWLKEWVDIIELWSPE